MVSTVRSFSSRVASGGFSDAAAFSKAADTNSTNNAHFALPVSSRIFGHRPLQASFLQKVSSESTNNAHLALPTSSRRFPSAQSKNNYFAEM